MFCATAPIEGTLRFRLCLTPFLTSLEMRKCSGSYKQKSELIVFSTLLKPKRIPPLNSISLFPSGINEWCFIVFLRQFHWILYKIGICYCIKLLYIFNITADKHLISRPNQCEAGHTFSYSAHFNICKVSRNLSSADALPKTTIIPSSPLFPTKEVDRHPPALFVIPVFTPTMLDFSSSLLVFVQYTGLQTTFPSLKNLKSPLCVWALTIFLNSSFFKASCVMMRMSSQQL